ncbi:hypothetical protein [Arthrobacter sp. H35-D1]|uniref:hypothetical protein n=1 Tax=Arthrobacter sp. H35-D1 TaxID=3046202 RepID=UPI0024BBC131|nr:hypothetical protein [Arthrobacter sp. H35-D1]MDJ0312073.1 hypothetical protein [Arthrobacter sp. H35-D1]
MTTDKFGATRYVGLFQIRSDRELRKMLLKDFGRDSTTRSPAALGAALAFLELWDRLVI